MRHSASFSSQPPAAPSSRVPARTALGVRGAAEFLGAHDKLGALLPAISRMAQLQRDCAQHLPAMFSACQVLQFASGQLILTAPNSALAAKLKQQLPKLQESLGRQGWQVDAIRLKVQTGRPPEIAAAPRRLRLSPQALPALAALDNQLEDSPRNAALKAAIETMLRRHRQPLP